MKALAIVDGDLTLGRAGFAEVTGSAKVIQDLRIAMTEPMGINRFHPRWGSMLPRYIGRPADAEAAMLIRSEVARVVRNYMAIQASYMQQDALAGVKPRFEAGEIVARLDGIEIFQEADRFHVRIHLRTLAQEQVVITETVAA